MIKNKKIIVLILSITTFITFLLINTSIQAYTDIAWDKKLTSGKDIAYFITSGCEYTASIPEAVKLLRYPSGMWNPIVLTKTTVQKQSKMDFYQIYNDGEYSNTSAYTIIYRKTDSGYTGLKVANGYTQPDQYDWVYGDITLNDYLMRNYGDSKKLTILHEMLHVYGLRDLYSSDKTWSIMYGYRSGRTATGLTSDANQVLVNKYNY